MGQFRSHWLLHSSLSFYPAVLLRLQFSLSLRLALFLCRLLRYLWCLGGPWDCTLSVCCHESLDSHKLYSLESVCFAILVGMSCDFVLHFGHAYSSQRGSLSKHIRTKDALVKMGPSILAAAATTIASAVVMMFTTILFFQRFAVILYYSLVMGLFGSACVFIVLTDTFGPAEPTALGDSLFQCTAKKSKRTERSTKLPMQLQEEDLSPEIFAE